MVCDSVLLSIVRWRPCFNVILFLSYLTFDQECSWVWMKNQVDFTRKLGLKTNTLEVKVLIKIIFKLVKTLIVTDT